MQRINKFIAMGMLASLLYASGTAMAGDPWYRVCWPIKNCKPRCDCEGAWKMYRWAAREVHKGSPLKCRKRCSLSEACREYRCALDLALSGPSLCCDARCSLEEACDAYKRAAREICRCHECESRQQ